MVSGVAVVLSGRLNVCKSAFCRNAASLLYALPYRSATYAAIRDALAVPAQGYVTHESCAWSPAQRRWFFLPRRVSVGPWVSCWFIAVLTCYLVGWLAGWFTGPAMPSHR
jgi:hypothetical protein